MHRSVSIFIVFAGAANVIIGKSKGADPVLSLLCFQRMQGLGHTFCGMMHELASKQNEIIKIEKVFKLL
jgi:hypothetical protein